MTQFEFLTVAISFVLGLAVTVLLTSLITAFRARRKTRMDWLPFAWAAYLLVIEFEVWWELYGLVSMEHWSVGAFVLVLLIALLLFAAGALILPTSVSDYPEDLDQYFREDGKWGVALVGAFQVTAQVANIALFDIPWFGYMNIWNAVAIGLILSFIVAKQRAVRSMTTVVFGIWVGVYLWVFVPTTY